MIRPGTPVVVIIDRSIVKPALVIGHTVQTDANNKEDRRYQLWIYDMEEGHLTGHARESDVLGKSDAFGFSRGEIHTLFEEHWEKLEQSFKREFRPVEWAREQTEKALGNPPAVAATVP